MELIDFMRHETYNLVGKYRIDWAENNVLCHPDLVKIQNYICYKRMQSLILDYQPIGLSILSIHLPICNIYDPFDILCAIKICGF